MNILDKLAETLAPKQVKRGYMPDKPDTVIVLFEYEASPPEHSFGGTDFIHNVQVRTRALAAAEAYTMAEDIAQKLNREHDGEISVLQSTPILDIGRDAANPPRQEYTVNFTIRRLK